MGKSNKKAKHVDGRATKVDGKAAKRAADRIVDSAVGYQESATNEEDFEQRKLLREKSRSQFSEALLLSEHHADALYGLAVLQLEIAEEECNDDSKTDFDEMKIKQEVQNSLGLLQQVIHNDTSKRGETTGLAQVEYANAMLRFHLFVYGKIDVSSASFDVSLLNQFLFEAEQHFVAANNILEFLAHDQLCHDIPSSTTNVAVINAVSQWLWKCCVYLDTALQTNFSNGQDSIALFHKSEVLCRIWEIANKFDSYSAVSTYGPATVMPNTSWLSELNVQSMSIVRGVINLVASWSDNTTTQITIDDDDDEIWLFLSVCGSLVPHIFSNIHQQILWYQGNAPGRDVSGCNSACSKIVECCHCVVGVAFHLIRLYFATSRNDQRLPKPPIDLNISFLSSNPAPPPTTTTSSKHKERLSKVASQIAEIAEPLHTLSRYLLLWNTMNTSSMSTSSATEEMLSTLLSALCVSLSPVESFIRGKVLDYEVYAAQTTTFSSPITGRQVALLCLKNAPVSSAFSNTAAALLWTSKYCYDVSILSAFPELMLSDAGDVGVLANCIHREYEQDDLLLVYNLACVCYMLKEEEACRLALSCYVRLSASRMYNNISVMGVSGDDQIDCSVKAENRQVNLKASLQTLYKNASEDTDLAGVDRCEWFQQLFQNAYMENNASSHVY